MTEITLRQQLRGCTAGNNRRIAQSSPGCWILDMMSRTPLYPGFRARSLRVYFPLTGFAEQAFTLSLPAAPVDRSACLPRSRAALALLAIPRIECNWWVVRVYALRPPM